MPPGPLGARGTERSQPVPQVGGGRSGRGPSFPAGCWPAILRRVRDADGPGRVDAGRRGGACRRALAVGSGKRTRGRSGSHRRISPPHAGPTFVRPPGAAVRVTGAAGVRLFCRLPAAEGSITSDRCISYEPRSAGWEGRCPVARRRPEFVVRLTAWAGPQKVNKPEQARKVGGCWCGPGERCRCSFRAGSGSSGRVRQHRPEREPPALGPQGASRARKGKQA